MGEREARGARRERSERLGQASGERSEPRAASGANDDTRAASNNAASGESERREASETADEADGDPNTGGAAADDDGETGGAGTDGRTATESPDAGGEAERTPGEPPAGGDREADPRQSREETRPATTPERRPARVDPPARRADAGGDRREERPDLEDAEAALVREITNLTRRAEETRDVGRKRDFFAAAREAAETLETIRRV